MHPLELKDFVFPSQEEMDKITEVLSKILTSYSMGECARSAIPNITIEGIVCENMNK